jgi:hypothetical protein
MWNSFPSCVIDMKCAVFVQVPRFGDSSITRYKLFIMPFIIINFMRAEICFFLSTWHYVQSIVVKWLPGPSLTHSSATPQSSHHNHMTPVCSPFVLGCGFSFYRATSSLVTNLTNFTYFKVKMCVMIAVGLQREIRTVFQICY